MYIVYIVKPTIKFSHRYGKLLDSQGRPVSVAVLLDVLPVKLEELSKTFLNYDTGNGTYQLPQTGEYLLLLFERMSGHAGGLFTTLRRRTEEKENFYREQIGKLFDVVIKKEEV